MAVSASLMKRGVPVCVLDIGLYGNRLREENQCSFKVATVTGKVQRGHVVLSLGVHLKLIIEGLSY